LILSLFILFLTGLEGYICVIMAMPLMAAGMAIGALAGWFLRGRFLREINDPRNPTTWTLIALPFLLAAANEVERPFRNSPRMETFTSAGEVAPPPGVAWRRLAILDAQSGDKPFLLDIGLPVPQLCEFGPEEQHVGGKRVCHFDQGIIEQEVTGWRPA